MPQIATVVYILGICGLFWLDRDRESHTSKALWIPVIWLLINGSRPVSVWLQVGPVMDSPDKYLDGSPLDAVFWGILLLAGLIVLARRSNQVGTVLRANAPIIIFFAYCAVSIAWSDYSFVALKRWTKAVGDVVMILIVLTDRDRRAAIKQLLTRTGFVLVPLSVLLVKYYPDLGRSYNPWSWEPMYSGVTMGKNMLGVICLVFGLGSAWQFIASYRSPKSRRRTRHMIAHGVLLGMVIWLLVIADSMTSLACFIMGSALIVVTSFSRSARKPVVLHFVVAAVVSVSVMALFFDPGGSLVGTLGRDPTLTGRTQIWNVVLSLVRHPLLGTGFESFWLGDRLLKVWQGVGENGIQEAHNGYLELYLNLGWAGIVLLSMLIITGYRKVIAEFRRDRDLGRLKLAFLVVGIVYSLTEAGFRMMNPVWIAFLLAITVVPPIRQKKVRYEREQTDGLLVLGKPTIEAGVGSLASGRAIGLM